MALKTKTSLIVLLLVFIFISPSSGLVEGFRESQYRPRDLLYKDGMKMNSRKLLTHGFELDYDDAGPNQRHTRKPGKGT
ncbi:uncharacterized protein LOC114746646 [Neltuma alba]|uniref:uncharacterized protein LOC114746646 n=1 Tax=Neltuma alba TaxID=207710 RepID=UPI0010A35D9C|nr:uncharacterized protein LOC114746646 [Prosopis alba]